MNFACTACGRRAGRAAPARPAGRRGASRAAAPPRPPAAPRRRPLLLARELVLDLARRRVDERARPVDDLGGVELGDLAADGRQLAEALLVVRARCRSGSPRAGSAGPGPEVRTVRVSSPCTSTRTASSPKSRLKRSVVPEVLEPRSTSVSVAALGSSRSASAAPPSASTAVTPSTSSGRRVTAPTSRRSTRSITQSA